MNNPDISRPGFARLPRLRRGERLIAPAFRFALLFNLVWMGTLASRADTHYVSLAGTNDSGNGYITWSGAATNIQWAVDAAAASGDTVLVSNGTYNLTNQLSIIKSVTVRSLYGTNNISTWSIINGDYPEYTNRCVYMGNGSPSLSPVLDGFIITNGYRLSIANRSDGGGGVCLDQSGSIYNCFIGWNKVSCSATYGAGGGICVYKTTAVAPYPLNITNCTIVSNAVLSGHSGGGIYSAYAYFQVLSCRISGNSAAEGGGLYVPNIVVSNCTVDGNNATNYDGGGIWANITTITDCVVSNNSAKRDGAGIFMWTGGQVLNSIITKNNLKAAININRGENAIISNCQVTANTVGGILCDSSSYGASNRIYNCTIANNLGRGLEIYGAATRPELVQNCLIYGNTNTGTTGGGVYINYTGPYPYGLINCTIAGNQANKLGGGLYTTTTNNYIANCIIYGNVTTNDVNDEVYVNTADGTNNFWYNCTPNMLTNLPPAQGNIANNPLFVDAGNRNYRLGSGSPCINAGTNMSWMTNSIDLDRKMRIRYGTVDMGAYEAIYSGTIYGFR